MDHPTLSLQADLITNRANTLTPATSRSGTEAFVSSKIAWAMDSYRKQINDVNFLLPKGWTRRRLKRRRSYARRDESFAWILDVTKVTSTGPDETAVGTRALVQRHPC